MRLTRGKSSRYELFVSAKHAIPHGPEGHAKGRAGRRRRVWRSFLANVPILLGLAFVQSLTGRWHQWPLYMLAAAAGSLVGVVISALVGEFLKRARTGPAEARPPVFGNLIAL